MCGIAAMYSSKNLLGIVDQEVMKSALSLQQHRGPDATGIWCNEKIILGHNRLSIIDLSHYADQPLYRADLGLRIAFNGEIYNFKSLKRELESKGYTFDTSSDTEVLLAGYHAFGEYICEKLTGMFAFLIWDEAKNELFVARDRFGEKPIFFVQEDNKFFFASELNSLREIYQKQLNINHDAVVDLVENLYINLHHTIYDEVKVFPPASSLKVSASGELKWRTYYKIPTEVGDPIPFKELKKLTREKLYAIVSDQLNADVPVATFLSAGVDSGLITAIAKDIKPDITAVTMSTNEQATDETEGAKSLAKKLAINHEIVPVNTDSIAVLANNLKDIQPLADASLIPSHLVTNKVKGRYTVMLSGDGGDEIFGSYNKPNLYLSLNRKGIPLGSKLIEIGLGLTNPTLAPKIRSRLNDRCRMSIGGWEGFYASNNLTGGLMQKVFLKGKAQNQPQLILANIKADYSKNPEKISFGVDFQSRLPGDFLLKVDTAAMHSSIEVRAPFLDHELVDFLMQVPTKSLMPNAVDKELSKALLSDFTGSDWHAPKRGFTIPYWEYLQREWGDLLENYLNEGYSESAFYFNKAGILDLLNAHRKQANSTYGRVLFAVLVLEIWLRVFHLAPTGNLSAMRKVKGEI